jgi:hypothetical protein
VRNYVHKHAHIHDGHFVQRSKIKLLFFTFPPIYMIHHWPPDTYNTRHVCTYGRWAMLSTKLASFLLLWQAIFFFHFWNSVKQHDQMSRKIMGNHMITFIVSVYSFILFTYITASYNTPAHTKLHTFPEPLYKITHLYSILNPFIHVQHYKILQVGYYYLCSQE